MARGFAGLSRAQIVQGASQYLSKEALEIFRVQLYLQPLHKFGRRWPPQFRGFALKLHFMGPRAYRYLSSYLTLPTERSLQMWLQDIAVQPGVMPAVLEGLQARLKGLPLKERTCVLLFDEMSIKEHLQYDSASDMVYGYADNGHERSPQLANSALLVVLSGISKSWVQPLSYVFSKSTASPGTVECLLVDLIRRLNSADIFVKAVICDQGASNCALARRLDVSPSRPFFTVDQSKIYFIFDPPHLMKTTRNLLLKYDLQIGDTEQKVQWSFIREFYESDHPLRVRLAPKLTDSHICPTVFSRMRVKLATQVLSDSVSTGIAAFIAMGRLPPAASATSDFLLEMDILFDTLNSSCVDQGDDRKMRFAMAPSTRHREVLESAVQRISQWKFVGCTRQPPTVTGWQVTIRAVLALWDDLQQNLGFECLLTRRLNQDPLENLFGQLRQMQGCNETPNAFQFVAGLKHTLAGRLLKLPTRGNCEADTAVLLNELKRMPVSSASSTPSEETGSERELLPVQEPADEPVGLIEANAQYAYAGSLVQSFLRRSKCQDCPGRVKASEGELESSASLFSISESKDS